MPTRFPRRVSTGPIRRTSTGSSLRPGLAHAFMLTRGQALYAMHTARSRAI